MLKAIIHGKARRVDIDGQSSVRWASLFKAYEDLLTSTIFERFSYLSNDVQNELMNFFFTVYFGEKPSNFGEFKSITYWPRYDHEHSDGTNQVEPDLILHFSTCDIIVEVKPPNGGDQYADQWKKEVESFLQSQHDQSKPLYFLAIGRIEQSNAKRWADELLVTFDKDNEYGVLKGVAALKWRVITEFLVNLTNNNKTNAGLGINIQDQRILRDMLEGLSLYGLQVSPFKWSQFKTHTLSKLSLEHNILHSLSPRFTDDNKQLLFNELLPNSFKSLDLKVMLDYQNNT